MCTRCAHPCGLDSGKTERLTNVIRDFLVTTVREEFSCRDRFERMTVCVVHPTLSGRVDRIYGWDIPTRMPKFALGPERQLRSPPVIDAEEEVVLTTFLYELEDVVILRRFQLHCHFSLSSQDSRRSTVSGFDCTFVILLYSFPASALHRCFSEAMNSCRHASHDSEST